MKSLKALIFVFILGTTVSSAQSIGVGTTFPVGVFVDASTLGSESNYGVYTKLSATSAGTKLFNRFGVSLGIERKIGNFSVGIHGSGYFNETTSESMYSATKDTPKQYSFFEGYMLDATAGIKLGWKFSERSPFVVNVYADMSPLYSRAVNYNPKTVYYSTSKATADTYIATKTVTYNQEIYVTRNKPGYFRWNEGLVFGVSVGYSF